MHPRHSIIEGRKAQHLLILGDYQLSRGEETVGEGGKIGQVGQHLLQKGRANEGIGVAVDPQCPPLFFSEGDDQLLPRFNVAASP